jgi:hypothetical protein
MTTLEQQKSFILARSLAGLRRWEMPECEGIGFRIEGENDNSSGYRLEEFGLLRPVPGAVHPAGKRASVEEEMRRIVATEIDCELGVALLSREIGSEARHGLLLTWGQLEEHVLWVYEELFGKGAFFRAQVEVESAGLDAVIPEGAEPAGPRGRL